MIPASLEILSLAANDMGSGVAQLPQQTLHEIGNRDGASYMLMELMGPHNEANNCVGVGVVPRIADRI